MTPSELEPELEGENGVGYKSGREKVMAARDWEAERRLMTMCVGAAAEACAEVREVAMREGMRREKATRGWGSIEMELKEDRVAPWKRL